MSVRSYRIQKNALEEYRVQWRDTPWANLFKRGRWPWEAFNWNVLGRRDGRDAWYPLYTTDFKEAVQWVKDDQLALNNRDARRTWDTVTGTD